MSKKVLNHPDKEDMIKRLLGGDSVKEVERWLKEKYPRSKRLHVSYMTLQKFRADHLNLKGDVLGDIKNRRTELDKDTIEAETMDRLNSLGASLRLHSTAHYLSGTARPPYRYILDNFNYQGNDIHVGGGFNRTDHMSPKL